jgi:hypothetical protein
MENTSYLPTKENIPIFTSNTSRLSSILTRIMIYLNELAYVASSVCGVMLALECSKHTFVRSSLQQ